MAEDSFVPLRDNPPWDRWNYEKNVDLLPEDVAAKPSRKVWWVCEKDHDFQQAVSDRVERKSGCPYCVNRRVLKGFNDLATVSPEIANQWHPTKNGLLTPSDVLYGSGKRYWWVCGRGHEWEAQLHYRVNRNSGCKVCLGQAPEVGVNDLATTGPYLASQWNHERNTLKPTEVMRFSGKKVWWKCSRGHAFEAAVSNRSQGSGCPICSGRKLLQGFNDLETLDPDLSREWHPTKNPKPPSEVRAADPAPWWWICSEGHEFQASRKHGRGNCRYCSGKEILKGENDLASVHPELLNWWDPSRNSEKPEDILPSSDDRFAWVCPEKHHRFEQTVYERRVGAGCPVCVGKHVIAGVNDLLTQNPLLAEQWDFRKNSIEPSTITAGSHKKAWWKCPLGHSWEAIVKNRTNGDGCPYCANRKLLKGFNDLQTVAPHLENEWDLQGNDAVPPAEVCIGDDAPKSWICANGHTWVAKLRTRVAGSGCRVCLGQAVDVGKTDLATTHPGLAAEWHPSKNAPLTPQDVMAGTGSHIWWQCAKGHDWRTTGNSRLTYQTGCPSCANRGFNPTKPGLIYFIRHNGYRAKKVGITGKSTSRIQDFRDNGWEVLQTWENQGAVIAETETRFFKWLRRELEIPPYLGREEMRKTGGWSETFDEAALSDSEIVSKIESLLNTSLA
jgi:hypothetical protein